MAICDMAALPSAGTAVALGNFDGVHLGHRQVLKAAAGAQGLHSAALVFSAHPAAALGKTPPPVLISRQEKRRLFEELGIQSVCVVDFEKIRHSSGEAFVRDILISKMHAKALFCGFNYHCGENASCGTRELAEICAQYDVRLTVLPAISFEGAPISSTRIRNALSEGDVTAANKMLGRAFSYDFEVVSGDRRGRLLGFPTINQFFPEDFVKPRFGVYASRSFVNGEWYPSVTNFGSRPTFQGESPRSETCILHYKGDLYGKNVPVSLLRFLRSEEKFPSFEAIKAQIALDSERAERIFYEEGGASYG